MSEQTGGISVAFRGRLKQRLDEGELRSELSRIFRIRAQDVRARGRTGEPVTEATCAARPIGSAGV